MSENTNNPGPTSDDAPTGDAPNPQTGVGIGAGSASTFEPEEDSATVSDVVTPQENPGPQS